MARWHFGSLVALLLAVTAEFPYPGWRNLRSLLRSIRAASDRKRPRCVGAIFFVGVCFGFFIAEYRGHDYTRLRDGMAAQPLVLTAFAVNAFICCFFMRRNIWL